MKKTGSEETLARKVVDWLTREGYETWEEVSIGTGRIDIVARRAPVILAIECKTSLSLAVLGQAARWSGIAHQSYAAVPNKYRTNQYMNAICQAIGVGIIAVGWEISVAKPAPFIRGALTHNILRAINDGNRTGAGNATAGTNGGYWSPWRETITQLARAVHKTPGITLRDALAKIDHHYSTDATARSSLSHWIRLGKVAGIEARRDGRKLRLYPTTPPPALP